MIVNLGWTLEDFNTVNNPLNKRSMNVNDLMNMNDMYYVGNLVDVDGNGWVSKAEAQAILDELMGDDNN
jgi:hypothetical protein